MKNIVYSVSHVLMFIINKIWGVNNKKIVFTSFNGKSYSDNPKAISEKLNEIDPELEQVWLFRSPGKKADLLPEYIKPVKLYSLRSLYEQSTAKVWVDNFSKPLWVYKSKEQFYIQTYHADRGFKKINLDNPIKSDKKYIESNYCNLMLSGSKFFENYHINSFNYKGEVLKHGSPRCDLLLNKDDSLVSLVKNKLNIPDSDKVFLYAPTFRSDDNQDDYLSNEQISLILNTLEEKTSSSWKCIIRFHVNSNISDHYEDERIINATHYEDMAEILLISNLLITDYSSCAGDFLLLNRPVFLYHKNLEHYKNNERDFYFNVEESPYITAHNFNELLNWISSINELDHTENCKKLQEFYGVYETGLASRKVARYLKEAVIK